MRTEGAPGLGGGRAAPQPVKVMTTQIAAAALDCGSILRVSEGPTARAGIDCRRRQRMWGLLALTRGTQEVAESDAADPLALSSGKGSDRGPGAPIAKAEPRADGDESWRQHPPLTDLVGAGAHRRRPSLGQISRRHGFVTAL